MKALRLVLFGVVLALFVLFAYLELDAGADHPARRQQRR